MKRSDYRKLSDPDGATVNEPVTSMRTTKSMFAAEPILN